MTLPSERGETYGEHGSHRANQLQAADGSRILPTPYYDPDDLARRLDVAGSNDGNDTVQTPEGEVRANDAG